VNIIDNKNKLVSKLSFMYKLWWLFMPVMIAA
jgi:hypothetical protein